MTLVDPPPPVVNSRDLVGVLVAKGLTNGVGVAVGEAVGVAVCIDLRVSCVELMAVFSLAAGSIDCRLMIATGLLMILLLTTTVVVK